MRPMRQRNARLRAMPAVVAAGPPPLSAFWDDNPEALIVVMAVGMVLLVALLFAMLLLHRRQQGRDIRQIVQAVEDLRAGQLDHRPQVDDRSPVAALADAVSRLGEDLEVRSHETEGTDNELRALLEATRDAAVVWTDADGDVVRISPSGRELFGWDEDALFGKSAATLFEEQAWKDLLPLLMRRKQREGGLDARARMRRGDGDRFEAQLAVRMTHDSGGHFAGFLMIVRDVTARLGLEQEVADADKRYRTLVDRLEEGVFVSKAGRFVYSNPVLSGLCGISADGLLERGLEDLVRARDLLVVRDGLRRLESGEEQEIEIPVGLADGHTDVTVRATRIDYHGGPAVLGMIRDETQRRRIAADLRRNELRLDAILESNDDGVLVLNDAGEGIVQLTNRAFAARYGCREVELLGLDGRRLRSWLRGRGESGELLAEALEQPIACSSEVPVSFPDGRDAELLVGPLRDRTGRIVGRMVICRDRTEHRRSEEELRRQARELSERKQELEHAYSDLARENEQASRRSDELDRLNKELRVLDEMKTNLLGNVSHELQTPLVSIRGYTEMILKGRLGAITTEQRKGLDVSLANIDRLISMIDNLLEFSRSTRQVGRLRPSDFPLGPALDEAVALMAPKLEQRGVELTQSYEDRGIQVRGDRDLIMQVFVNLLSNAIKFNQEGGTVEIHVRTARGGQVGVRVRDSGRGFPAADSERIFERSYRSEGGRDEDGHGLGLSIVRDILRMHGCSIRAEGKEGSGATFTFTLPGIGSKTVTEDPGDEAPVQTPSPAGVESPEIVVEPPAPAPEAPSEGSATVVTPRAGAPEKSERRRLRIIRPHQES
ncbi:hypothetical protein ABI59_04350 [Acidobacteria bacterium Mor1]|nr:hypothetical protein ABI59_04350 [Acidobacteria bacterium Mor1]